MVRDWRAAALIYALLGVVFVPLSEWTLSQAAVPSSLVVTVNGIPVGWSAENGYTYDAGANLLQFHGTAVPPPGQRVDVRYVGNCRP